MGRKVFKTFTVKPGVYVDVDEKGNLLGIEIIDASEVMGEKIEFTFPALSVKKAVGQ
ncbi:DUF2283 domain-containing protein [Desulfurobacterium sp.]